MHFHLPKPLHGWRAFAGEVGIIVVGVLIALGAEQVVENLQWRHKVDIVRKSLMGELGNDRARWDRDLLALRCAHNDIERLDSWANNGAAGQPPPSPALRSGNLLSMHTASWKLAAGSETLDHFPLREQLAFAALYDGLANRAIDINNASGSMDRIHTLVPLAGDEQGRRELRETLGDLRAESGNLLSNVSYMGQHFDAVGAKPDRSDFAGNFQTPTCD